MYTASIEHNRACSFLPPAASLSRVLRQCFELITAGSRSDAKNIKLFAQPELQFADALPEGDDAVTEQSVVQEIRQTEEECENSGHDLFRNGHAQFCVHLPVVISCCETQHDGQQGCEYSRMSTSSFVRWRIRIPFAFGAEVSCGDKQSQRIHSFGENYSQKNRAAFSFNAFGGKCGRGTAGDPCASCFCRAATMSGRNL